MRTLAFLLVAVTILASACDVATPKGLPAESPRAEDQATERAARIYASVIRQLVTREHTSGERSVPFERIFVVDRPVDAAGTAYVGGDEATGGPFPPALESNILRALTDLPPVRFVGDSADVIASAKPCPHVGGRDALIGLGPVAKARHDAVTVASWLSSACLGGVSATYVLKRAGAGWHVVGTEGPVAIS